MITNHRHKKDGFTFVELLIVVAVTGILVSLAYLAYSTILGDTKIEKQNVAIQRVEEAKTRYYLDFPSAPTDVSPPLTNLVYYLEIPAGVGTNAFYNVKGGLFDGCFPTNQKVFLSPNGQTTTPNYQYY